MDMRAKTVDWAAVNADPRFRDLHRRKSRFLWGLMAFSVAYYFLLPLGAAYASDLFRVKLWGPVNVGLVFAWSEFLVAWASPSSMRGARTASSTHSPPRSTATRWPRPRR